MVILRIVKQDSSIGIRNLIFPFQGGYDSRIGVNRFQKSIIVWLQSPSQNGVMSEIWCRETLIGYYLALYVPDSPAYFNTDQAR